MIFHSTYNKIRISAPMSSGSYGPIWPQLFDPSLYHFSIFHYATATLAFLIFFFHTFSLRVFTSFFLLPIMPPLNFVWPLSLSFSSQLHIPNIKQPLRHGHHTLHSIYLIFLFGFCLYVYFLSCPLLNSPLSTTVLESQ